MDTSKIFFTSDNHWGHKKIPEYCPKTRQQGLTPEQLDEVMIKRWNEVVPEDAIIYNLGDLTFYRDLSKIAAIMPRLNGQEHHLILGNHDQLVKQHRQHFLDYGLVTSIQDYREETLDGILVSMFHFPQAVWNKNHHGAFHVYGHCHGSFKAVGKQMDVGWDTLDLGTPFVDHIPGPISWTQVKACLNARDKVIQDHHDTKKGVIL